MTRRPLLVPSLLLLAAASALLGQVQITSTSPLPQGYVGISYNYTFTATAQPTATGLTWCPAETAPSCTSPPAGLTVSANGTLSGTPTAAGTFTFTVVAYAPNAGPPQSVSMNFSLTIVQPSIQINNTSPLPNAIVGQAYSDTLTASSTPAGPITWFLSDGAMPPGLTLSSSGVISGTPSSAGNYTAFIVAEISGTEITTSGRFLITVYQGQITIQTTSLPFATAGKVYSETLSVSPSGVTWTLSGTLPPGITFNTGTGVLSGTSTSVGIYPLQFTATLTNYLSATLNTNLDVISGPLAIPQPNLPPGVQGSPYTTTVGATGGITPYQFAFVNASNDGLSIGGSTGTITGTPTTSGSFFIPVSLSDATGSSIVVNLSLFVANPLSVSTTSLPNGSIGVAYSQMLQAGGGTAPFSWTIVAGSGSLPPGLSLSTAGIVSGTPTGNGGVYTFTVQVTDNGGRTATKALSIAVSVGTLNITNSSLPAALLNQAYSQTLTATGGAQPYTWRLASGAFPTGLILDPLKPGTIDGTPTGPLGASTFTIQVTDSSTPPQTVSKAFTITVELTLSITTLSLPNGTQGAAYSSTIAASGGTQPYTWSVTSGTTPPGLSLNTSSGVISGTPTATGTNVFSVTVTDAAGQTATAKLSVTINASGPALSITTNGSFPATVGTAFTLALAATGGTLTAGASYTWSASGLPAGLSVAGSTIGGTPTAAGNATVTLTVTDSQKNTATGSITINVALPPAPPVTIGTIGGAPAAQASPALTLNTSYPVALTGTLTVSFASSVGGNPTEVGFVTSGGGLVSAVSFNIPMGGTSAVFANSPVLATGTVAGTITLTATLNAGGTDVTPSPAPTETITISPAAPVIETVTFSNTGGGLTATVIGYSTTREMVSGQFQFYTSTGPILTPVDVTLSTAFSTWYQSSASNQYGSQFMLSVPFSVSGNPSDVVSVNAVLTNTKGASNSLQSVPGQ